ncbi:hypothetical protein WQ54_10810 [Bacillus sp. SA1-12]|uniref:hypothetical protein n=1 Tax=Bacillus sp. SA1-12 TaxID=1455638 RepID=UPI00062657AA|nr:hypothetical protein [Bacillus sp. SA1-12]KKI92176.1 hypothetical protein WQ54_10810 [Bacillus sp. SA1-12]
MKKLLISLVVLIVILTGCNQSASRGQGDSPEDIAKLAYEWEKANFDRDYEKEQEFLYEAGSYEIHKTTKKIDSGLQYKDIRFEIYHDKELEQYYVLADFENPNGENLVEDNILFRKKGEEWKVDTSKSSDIKREEVSGKFERAACINCE